MERLGGYFIYLLKNFKVVVMKIKNLLSRKRLLTFFSLFIVAVTSFNAWADSEYCNSLAGRTGNERAYFTWKTDDQGKIIIKIGRAHV